MSAAVQPRAGCVLLDRLWSVCEVVVVLYVLHVCMLRECEGARVTAMDKVGLC